MRYFNYTEQAMSREPYALPRVEVAVALGGYPNLADVWFQFLSDIAKGIEDLSREASVSIGLSEFFSKIRDDRSILSVSELAKRAASLPYFLFITWYVLTQTPGLGFQEGYLVFEISESAMGVWSSMLNPIAEVLSHEKSNR